MSDVEAKAITDGLLNNPVGFLSSNLLWMGGDNEGPPSRDTRRFEPTDINQGPRRFNGTPTGGKTYSIDEAMNGSLEAHYLPWNYDSGYFIVLEVTSPVKLMFTGTLSGCAVGYIMSSDGSARLSHHNILALDGNTDRNAMQDSLGFLKRSYHPKHYQYAKKDRNDLLVDGRAVVTAVHSGSGDPWRFYIQRFQVRKDNSDVIHDFAIRDAFQF